MTDIEIAKNVKLEKIEDIAKKLNIDEDDIECYGKYKAKISNEIYKKLENKKQKIMYLERKIHLNQLKAKILLQKIRQVEIQ